MSQGFLRVVARRHVYRGAYFLLAVLCGYMLTYKNPFQFIETVYEESYDYPLGSPPSYDESLFPPIQYATHEYPKYSTLLSVLEKWNPNSPVEPVTFTESLLHFNYSNKEERDLAKKYRNAELPFKLYDVPLFNNVSRLWTRKYLSRNFKNMKYHIEESRSNRFMYWTRTRKRIAESYEPPTRVVSDKMDFSDWSDLAEKADSMKLDANKTHFYFMSGSQRSDDDRNFIYRDLPVFRSETPNFFIPNPERNKGIQCRFGMRGVIAESHYDSGRNSIAMVKGRKRYILSPPESCKYLSIISDKKHPSFRHSLIDFSDLAQARANNFAQVKSIETVVRTGEVLYLPSFWFHYIVSLDYSIQCNSRSGFPDENNGKSDIEKCMKMKIRS